MPAGGAVGFAGAGAVRLVDIAGAVARAASGAGVTLTGGMWGAPKATM